MPSVPRITHPSQSAHRPGQPIRTVAQSERALLTGIRSAESILASGYAECRSNRPDTWQLRPVGCHRSKNTCQYRAIHTWNIVPFERYAASVSLGSEQKWWHHRCRHHLDSVDVWSRTVGLRFCNAAKVSSPPISAIHRGATDNRIGLVQNRWI